MKQRTNTGRKAQWWSGTRVSLASFTVTGRFLLVISVLTAVMGMASNHAHAGFLGHNGLGDFGLQSGTQPDPGTSLSAMYLRYDSDTLRDRDGNQVSLDPKHGGSIAVNAYALGLYYVSNFKLLGGSYGFMIFPGFTDNSLEIPILDVQEGADFGFTDLYIQPINLGWHTERADFIAGLGLFAPTGSYDPDASDNLGLGMWSFEISAGTTIYFDKAKTWHFATTAFYEMHTEKKDTDIRVGDILTLEGGLGKSFMEGAVNVGLAYYAQWKITEDDFGQDIEQALNLLGLPEPGKHRGYGFGPEVTVPIATKSKLYGLVTARYFWETGVESSLEGNTLVLMATFPIPSVPLQ
jgi:hypothetical protein